MSRLNVVYLLASFKQISPLKNCVNSYAMKIMAN